MASISGSPDCEREADSIAESIASSKPLNFISRNVPMFAIARQAAPSGGMVHKFQAEFERAAATSEVPVSWATDPDLISLVRSELGLIQRPRIQEAVLSVFSCSFEAHGSRCFRGSYGTVDPYWQAVEGFRYIKEAYRTPTRAWKFFQATTKKNASWLHQICKRKLKNGSIRNGLATRAEPNPI